MERRAPIHFLTITTFSELGFYASLVDVCTKPKTSLIVAVANMRRWNEVDNVYQVVSDKYLRDQKFK